MPQSDKYGRAFEYCITKGIISELEAIHPGKVEVTWRAKDSQNKGEEQYKTLSEPEQKQFENSSKKISKWLAENKFKNIGSLNFEKPVEMLAFLTDKEVIIDRIPDSEGIEGDVTDIRIKFLLKDGTATLNISLKHEHTALKHPRLTRVPEWIGMSKDGEEAIQYEKDYDAIWTNFFEKGKKLVPDAKRFKELKSVQKTFIEDNLYNPLYSLVRTFLEKNTNSPEKVQKMFDFIVGKFDFIKFIDIGGAIEMLDFSLLTKPKSVKVNYKDGDYLYIEFDNGLITSGRLHTATEWLAKSIKFDMQPVNLDSLITAIRI